MKISKRIWPLALLVLFVGSTSAFAQSRIQLVQGRRLVKDKVTFVVDVSPSKVGSQRPTDALMVYTRFERPATGLVYLDGKAIGRFDDAMGFHSDLREIAYGRHTMTMVTTGSAIVFDFTVTTSTAVATEVLEGVEPDAPRSPLVEQRLVELERKVHDLEAQIATLKKNRAE